MKNKNDVNFNHFIKFKEIGGEKIIEKIDLPFFNKFLRKYHSENYKEIVNFIKQKFKDFTSESVTWKNSNYLKKKITKINSLFYKKSAANAFYNIWEKWIS